MSGEISRLARRFLIMFVLGAILGGSIVWLIYYMSTRGQVVRLTEEKQLLQQEKQIVVEFMHNLVEAIGSGEGRAVLLQRIVNAAILSTGAMSACVFELTSDKRLKGVAVEGLFPPQKPLPERTCKKISTRAKFVEQVLKSEVFDLGEGLVGSVARTGEAVLIEDAQNDPRVVQHEDASLTVRSIIYAPLIFSENVLGVLAVANPADGLSFNATDFSLVQSLAEQAAMAVHNADLMTVQMEKNELDFDLNMASSIQAMLLPRSLPKGDKLDIHAFYRPAQKVGGDLYDVIPIDDKRICIAIADVSGKGVPAALLMAICQTNLHHFVAQEQSPAAILKALNRAMAGEMRQEMFITLICAVIDLEQDTLTFARAGHELLLHMTRSEQSDDYVTHSVGADGMAVGMVPPAIFDEVIADKTISFRQGDIIVIYTDGITEATNEQGVEFSENRLRNLITTLRDRDAMELNQSIVSSVERFCGQNKFADDLTLIAVKHT